MNEGHPGLAEWLRRLYDLRRDKRGDHERPHKPVLLLAILDLVEQGQIRNNEIRPDGVLVQRFRRLFAAVARRDDNPTFENPFFYLSGDGFWRLIPRPGQPPPYQKGFVGRAPSLAQLRKSVLHAELDPGLWTLVEDPMGRFRLREALIARYFPTNREQLLAVIGAGAPASPVPVPEETESDRQARSAAFRHLVVELYRHQCAACGVRVRMDGNTLVEAAHLVPFRVTHDDRPMNGIALCPNHHWAMDRNLIAPCPDERHPAGIWRVHSALDDRVDHQRELVQLGGRPVIEPEERQFFPDRLSLSWRENRLRQFPVGAG